MPTDGTPSAPLPGVVAVVGLGLMGGSLCRSLRRVAPGTQIWGVDRSSVEGTRALEAGVVDRYDPDGRESVAAADLVVYATPLGATLGLLAEHARFLRPDGLVTDVVSLKAPILRAGMLNGLGGRLVGGHPVCGGEGSGSRPRRRTSSAAGLCGSALPQRRRPMRARESRDSGRP
jgi:prephenate dehydrogenase